MQVDDGEDQVGARGGFILQLDPSLQRTQIVAQMRDAGGLDAREDDLRARDLAVRRQETAGATRA